MFFPVFTKQHPVEAGWPVNFFGSREVGASVADVESICVAGYFQMNASVGIPNNITAYIRNSISSKNMACAIYNTANAKIATTAMGTITATTGGWRTFTVNWTKNATGVLLSGGYYYITIWSTSGTGTAGLFYNPDSGGGIKSVVGTDQWQWDDPVSFSTTIDADGTASIYCNYTIGASPATFKTVQTINGAIQNTTAWKTKQTIVGSIFNIPFWMTVQTMTGSISNVSGFRTIQTIDGSIQNTSSVVSGFFGSKSEGTSSSSIVDYVMCGRFQMNNSYGTPVNITGLTSITTATKTLSFAIYNDADVLVARTTYINFSTNSLGSPRWRSCPVNWTLNDSVLQPLHWYNISIWGDGGGGVNYFFYDATSGPGVNRTTDTRTNLWAWTNPETWGTAIDTSATASIYCNYTTVTPPAFKTVQTISGSIQNGSAFKTIQTISGVILNETSTFSDPSPGNGTKNIMKNTPLSITVVDEESDSCIICFYNGSSISGPWTKQQQNTSVCTPGGTIIMVPSSAFSTGWNTWYYWKVTANDTTTNSTAVYYFRTQPNPDKVASFIQMTDIHIASYFSSASPNPVATDGRMDDFSLSNMGRFPALVTKYSNSVGNSLFPADALNETVTYINAHDTNVDFAVTTGDLISPSISAGTDDRESAMAMADSCLDKLDVTSYVTAAGLHDDVDETDQLALFESYFSQSPLTFNFTDGSNLYVFLSESVDSGFAGSVNTTYLNNTLNYYKNEGYNAFVFTHMIPNAAIYRNTTNAVFQNILENYTDNYDYLIVIGGHNHMNQYALSNGVYYFTTTATMNYPIEYRQVDITNSSIHIYVVTPTSTKLTDLNADAYTVMEDIASELGPPFDDVEFYGGTGDARDVLFGTAWRTKQTITGNILNATAWKTKQTITGIILNTTAWRTTQTITGTILNTTGFRTIQTIQGVVLNATTFKTIQTIIGVIQNTTSWRTKQTIIGAILNTTGFKTIQTIQGAILNTTAWKTKQTITGMVLNITGWRTTQTINGVILNLSGFRTIQTISGVIQNTTAFKTTQTLIGTILNTTGFKTIQTINGIILNTTGFRTIQTLIGTIQNISTTNWKTIQTINGILQNTTQWHTTQTITGTITNIPFWNTIQTITGTIQNISGFRTIQTINGLIQNTTGFKTIQTINGVIINTTSWRTKQTITGGILNTTAWRTTQTIDGVIFNVSATNWRTIQIINGVLQNTTSWRTKQTITGEITNALFWSTTQTIIGTILNTTAWMTKQTIIGSIINTSVENITITIPYPGNGSTGIIRQPTCSILINHTEGKTMTLNWYENSTGSWVLRHTDASATNGTYTYPFVQASSYSTKYWWNVTVNDTVHSISRWYYFTTEAYVPPANNPPNTPSNPSPPDESTGIEIHTDLGWTGGDPDGDTVTYDVYFGTTITPPKLSGNQSGVTYEPGTMGYMVTYYWKISAWDEHGLKTAGPLWNFTTENAWVTIQIINGTIYNVSYGVNIINIYPANESHITKTQPTILFTLVNSTGSSNYTVYTGNLSTDVTHYLINDSFVGNGTYHADYYNATGYYVEYYWRVSVNDSSYWTNETYHFSVVHDGGMVPARSPLAIVGVMALFIALGIFLFIFVMKRRKENE